MKRLQKKRKETNNMNYYQALRSTIATHGIKLGDKIVVTHKPSLTECIGWTINWCLNMDRYVGEKGIVFEIGRNNGCSVSFESGECFSFPVFCLKVINPSNDNIIEAYKVLQKKSNLQINDLVQVTRGNTKNELGCACGDTDLSESKKEATSMNAIGKITKITPRSIRVKFGKCDWLFPYFALRKIEPKLEDYTTKYYSNGKDITDEISKNGLKSINSQINKRKKNVTDFKKNLVDISIPAATIRNNIAGVEPAPQNRTIMDLFTDVEQYDNDVI